MKELIDKLQMDEEYCPDCGEARFTDIEIYDSSTGGTVNLRMKAACSCQVKKAKEEEAEFNRNQEERRIKRLRQRYLFDSRLHNFTFDADDSPDSNISVICRRYIERWDLVSEKGYGILLSGNIGTGKTFYAACIVNALIDKGVAAELTTITRLLNTIAIEDRDQELAKLNRLPLIVIDDLGAERQTDYSRELAFTIIDERVKAKKPMIVTTNLPVAEMLKVEDLSLLRTYERVLEACPIRVALAGRSRRMKNDKENIAEAMQDLFG